MPDIAVLLLNYIISIMIYFYIIISISIVIIYHERQLDIVEVEGDIIYWEQMPDIVIHFIIIL